MSKESFIMKLNELVDTARAEQAAGSRVCPRCGNTNPRDMRRKSMFVDIHVCSDCHAQEAEMYEMHHTSMPLYRWACTQPKTPAGDFKAVDGEVAWAEVEKEQISTLLDIFGWLFTNTEREEHVVRAEAAYKIREKCKGVGETNIYPKDAIVDYPVYDGTLIVKFKLNDTSVMYAAGIVGKTGPVHWLTTAD